MSALPRRFAAGVAVLVASTCTTSSVVYTQATPERTIQRFRAGVEIIRLNVTAIGEGGRPVLDLTSADFDVKVDGSPRQVRFVRRIGGASGRAAGAPPATVFPGSYATNGRSSPGRAVMFVIDLDSMRAGTERTILDTAARLVESLGPNDAVGLAPVPGVSIDLTRDHARLVEALRSLHGTNTAPSGRHSLSLEEALAFDRAGPPNEKGAIPGGDQTIIRRVIERECDADDARRRPANDENPLRLICPPEIQREARERLAYERMHVQVLLSGLATIAERLQLVAAPRTLVLISGGLVFESEGLTWFKQAERALKQANVTLYAIHADQPAIDASISRSSEIQAYASNDRQTGLANVATMTGGAFFSGVGTAAGAFDRVKNEISSAYELGVEAIERDATRQELQVAIGSKRPGVTLRYRPQATFAPPPDGKTALASLISQPIDVPDVPIDAVAYTVRGEEPDTVRVLFVAEVGRGLTLADPVQYAMTVRSDAKTVFETNGTATRTGEIARLQLATQLAPALYRVRLAATDATGRGGALEVPVSVGLRAAGDLHLSDLILGQAGTSFTPGVHAAGGQPIASYIELYSADPAGFAGATLRFELRRAGDPAVLVTSDGTIRTTDLERRQIAEGSISSAGLNPGEYTISALIDRAGRPIGKVSRTVVLDEETVTAAATPASPTADATPPPIKLARGSDSALAEVVSKMGEYVADYGEKAGLLVAVEQYTQYEDPLPPRRITAEFALVKTAGDIGWTGFRDVVEVNGQPVRDRRDRLLRLFTESSSPLAEAIRIANESARFNVGPVSRNFNVPTTTLFFFHPANLSRFTFERKGTKRIDDVETWEINFVETRRPTMMGTRTGKDVPCQGTVWVVPSDGTIVRTRLRLRNFADAFSMGDVGAPRTTPGEFQTPTPVQPTPSSTGSGSTQTGSGSTGSPGPTQPGSPGGSGAPGSPGSSGGSGGSGSTVGATAGVSAGPRPRFEEFNMNTLESRADIEVTYRRDPQLSLWVPSRMSEEYQGAIPRIRRGPILGTARSIATYADFRRFETSAKVVSPK